MKKITITLSVNTDEYTINTHPNRTLLEVLREDLNLTGTKESCGEGVCGSCTVLLDGVPVRSCLLVVTEAAGKEITTIEGLFRDGKLDPVQDAFISNHAIQCGYCSPGMILTAYSLLRENPSPTEEEIRHAISGNICRCTGYAKIVEAVKSLSAERR
jgi:aerobic-type carbon monoxide dehydrogenase small subunit (CoxS/CutS family)